MWSDFICKAAKNLKEAWEELGTEVYSPPCCQWEMYFCWGSVLKCQLTKRLLSPAIKASSTRTWVFLKTQFIGLWFGIQKNPCAQRRDFKIISSASDRICSMLGNVKPRGGDIPFVWGHVGQPEACGKQKRLNNNNNKPYGWADNKDELLLNISLEYKVNKTQENAIRRLSLALFWLRVPLI